MELINSLGGNIPLTTKEFANRAYAYTLNPLRNPIKEVMDKCSSIKDTPPFLGIFNDIPWNKFRENEAHAWAKAGFTWIVNDAEHTQWEGFYGREQNAIESRLGLLSVQRLHREAISSYGDSYQLGARATLRPYGCSFEDAEIFFKSINFPEPGNPTPHDRGGYPVRNGDRSMNYTPADLRSSETETQGWIQFETAEYLIDIKLRDKILQLMVDQGRNRACGFVGPLDVILRQGEIPEVNEAINNFFCKATKLGIHTGRVVGSGSMEDPKDIEEGMVEAIKNGARLISVHPLTSDMTFRGAFEMAKPFYKACKRCGF